jgi:hypothetical protein
MTTGQSGMFRIRRNTDGLFLTRDDSWDTAALAWTTDYPPEAAERAFQAQDNAGHAFVADVVPA